MIQKITQTIGMRTIKTGISVCISVTICVLLGRENPTMAVLAAVFSMRADSTDGIKSGLSRAFGNLMGGFLALVFILFYRYMPNDAIGQITLLPIGVMLLIVILVKTNNNLVVVSATATFVTIFILSRQDPDFIFAFQRVIDTIIGTIVSFLVNRFIAPHTPYIDQQ